MTRELEVAETSLRQLDLTLTELDTRLCKVEADQSSWSQAPEYEALEAESLALELMTHDLRRLEEEVLKSKIATDSSQTASTTSMQKLVTIERRLTAAKEAVAARREHLRSLDVEPDPASQHQHQLDLS